MDDPGISRDEGRPTRSQKTTPEYQLLSPDTADAAAKLYTQVFLNDEPMTRHHRIDPFAFLPSAREYLRYCAEQQLSFIAVDRETREVMGFMLGSDLSTDWESVGPGVRTLLSFFRESMAIIEELEHRCPDLRDVRPGAVLHLFQAGVMRTYRGQGIATRLISRSLNMAKKRGFEKVIAECTGQVSRHTCEKCGFHAEAFVAYNEFQVDGRVFFQGLPGGISLMIRDV